MLYSTCSSLRKKLALAILIAAPAIAYAEVSDKEPSLAYIWSIGFAGALLCLIGGYYKRWLVLVLALFPALWFTSLLLEMHSADVGPALYMEQGWNYYAQAYSSLAVFTIGVVCGWLIRRRGKTR